MESTVAQNTHISNDFSHLSGVATVGAKALPLAFPTPEQESATLAPFRREVSQNYKVVMDICAYVDAPDDVRNLIDALISLSNGNVQVSANDYQIGAAFFNNEENRNRLKKKVQRWRSNLDKWQKASGVTLVQIRSGFRRTVYRGTVPQEQNVPSEYRIIVLDMAAKVLGKGNSDTASAIASVVDEMGGLASRVDEPRNHKRTPESLGRTAATWLRKSLEAARADAYQMSNFIRDLKDDLAEVFAEFGCSGEPITARQAPDGEPDLDTITTISSSSSNEEVVSNGEEDLIDSPLADAFHRLLAEIPDETAFETISGNSMPEDLPMVEYALAHARRGLRIFPVYQVHDGSCICHKAEVCESPAKHPRIKGWQNLATTDESQIRDWWKKWRYANIGIVTDDLLVLDVDPKNCGDVSLTELIEECGELPNTLTAITGSNGRHLLFSRPANVKIRNLQNSAKLGEGLDIRADGGFIVAVGSTHISGKRYRWIDESAAIEAAPSWLLERLTAPPAAPSESVVQREVSSGGTKHRRSAAAVWSAPVAEGARNSTLFRWASGLRGGGKSRDEILDSLRWRNSQCLPPLADVELMKIADSVASYPTNATKFGH